MNESKNSPAPSSLVPLWQQLQDAAAALLAVRQGRSLTDWLAAVPVARRAGELALASLALRQWGRAQAVRRLLARRAPPPELDALLCCALALACCEPPPYAGFTLVDQAVEAARRQRHLRAQAGFLNACLRRFARERAALLAAVQGDAVARWNHPLWWVQRLRRDHPRHWQALLMQAQRLPPMTLRVNLQKHSRAAYVRQLAQAGLAARALGPGHAAGIVLARPVPVQALPGFAQGSVSVQDAAAQRAAPLLLDGLPAGALRVLDACAAPGGKTAHLLELRPDAEVLALDVDAARGERIRANLARLGLAADVRVADAARPAEWWDGQPFDAVLLDAPCSASGISRRHPDARWLRRESDIAQLAATQQRLLAALWPLLKPGGRLLYATCSVFRAEGQEQLDRFLAAHADAMALPAPGHVLPPPEFAAPESAEPAEFAEESGKGRESGEDRHDDDTATEDDFFYALLAKTAA